MVEGSVSLQCDAVAAITTHTAFYFVVLFITTCFTLNPDSEVGEYRVTYAVNM